MTPHAIHTQTAHRLEALGCAVRDLFERNPEWAYTLTVIPGPQGSAEMGVRPQAMDAIWDVGGMAEDDPDEALDNLRVEVYDGRWHVRCTYDTGTGRATGVVEIVAICDARPDWLDRWEHTATPAAREALHALRSAALPEDDLRPALEASVATVRP